MLSNSTSDVTAPDEYSSEVKRGGLGTCEVLLAGNNCEK